MATFSPREISNPHATAMALGADFHWHPQGEKGHLALTLTPQPNGQWLSLLGGKLRFWLRGVGLTVQTEGATTDHGQNFFNSEEIIFTSESVAPQTVNIEIALTEPWGRLQAAVKAHAQQVAIAETQGLWPPDLSPNQLAIADRLLAKFLAETYLAPAICWGQWLLAKSADADPQITWQPLYDIENNQTLTEANTSNLGDRLGLIIDSPHLDCLALAKLVGLDPQRDLAGGKFVGANLNGIDLSNSLLMDSNFRGAILTDSDLSNADLRRTNFRGADLSGAYLEAANLHQGDFRKSSLAVANLIGTDLRRADLRGATLQNVNFSGARVENLHFGDNPGLTASQQAWLLENGAQLASESVQEMLR
ncbi:pentapeptide repeat-containing protein [Synechocystis sp. LEGE 06083]|uniref:pentapeptide repeat-containing protein n=1 Tax=Synechocystis sp. LEGE 06083 TaxID=915336 RepID=UPI001D1542FF|nr:pentapeptide repeat-containing protein [Synechocystis sp. LEGE 06083]